MGSNTNPRIAPLMELGEYSFWGFLSLADFFGGICADPSEATRLTDKASKTSLGLFSMLHSSYIQGGAFCLLRTGILVRNPVHSSATVKSIQPTVIKITSAYPAAALLRRAEGRSPRSNCRGRRRRRTPVSTARCSHGPRGRRPAHDRQNGDQLRRYPSGSYRRRQDVALVNGGAGSHPLVRDIHSNLELSRSLVRLQSSCHSLALRIRMDNQALGPIGEDSARPLVGQGKHHHSPCYRTIVFILYLDDWLARRAQFDVINGTLTVQDRNLQLGRLRLQRRWRTLE